MRLNHAHSSRFHLPTLVTGEEDYSNNHGEFSVQRAKKAGMAKVMAAKAMIARMRTTTKPFMFFPFFFCLSLEKLVHNLVSAQGNESAHNIDAEGVKHGEAG